MKKAIYLLASFVLILNVLFTSFGASELNNVKAADNGAIEGLTSFNLKVSDKDGNPRQDNIVKEASDFVKALYEFKFANVTPEKTVRFKLPEQLQTVQTYIGQPLDGGVGTFDLDKDGNVTLHITKPGAVTVQFEAESTINSKKPIDSGSTEIKYGEESANLVVDFAKGVPVEKKVTELEGTPAKFKWTIDVNTSLSDLKNLKVIDENVQGLTIDANSIKVNELKIKANADGSIEGVIGEVVLGKHSLKSTGLVVDLGNTNKAYRIEFISTRNVNEPPIKDYKNIAKVTSDGNAPQEDDATIKYVAGVKVEKDITNKDTIKSDNHIDYKIVLNGDRVAVPANTYFEDIIKSEITDKKFIMGELKGTDVKIVNKDTNETLVPGVDYKMGTIDNNSLSKIVRITFLKDFKVPYEVTYSVKHNKDGEKYLTTGTKVKNTATLYSDAGKDKKKFGEAKAEAELLNTTQQSEPSKILSYDYDKKEANYTLGFDVLKEGIAAYIYDWPASQLIDSSDFGESPTENFKKLVKNFKVTHEGKDITNLVKAAEVVKQADGSYRLRIFVYENGKTAEKGHYEIKYTLIPPNPDAGPANAAQNNYHIYDAKTGQLLMDQYTNHTFYYNDFMKNNGFKYSEPTKNDTGGYEKIKYGVGFNYNKHDLTGALLIDTLSSNHKYKEGTFKLYKWNIDSTNINKVENAQTKQEVTGLTWNETHGFKIVERDGKQSFEIDLNKLVPDTIGATDAYIVEYETIVNDQITEPLLKNSVEVVYNETVEKGINENKNKPNIDIIDIPRGSEHVSKDGVQVGKLAKWTVDINATQSKLSNVIVKDELSTGHSVIQKSFNLYDAQLVNNGTAQKPNYVLEEVGEPLVEGEDYTLEFTDNGYELKLAKDISTAYVLKYNSYITAKTGTKITNNVSIHTKEEIKTNTLDNSVIAVSSAGGSGTWDYTDTEVGAVKVEKVDKFNNEKLLDGAKFKLTFIDKDLESDQQEQTRYGTTENGVVTFNDIPLTSASNIENMTLIEEEAPEGYVKDSKEVKVELTTETEVIDGVKTFVVMIENEPKDTSEGNINITKVDQENKPLENATFTLTGPNGYTMTATSTAAGIVTFEKLQPGTYKLNEIQAPAGYVVEQKEGIVLEVKASETIEQTVVNKKYDSVTTEKGDSATTEKGILVINKMDGETNELLAGAKFEITGPNSYSETATTNEQGQITLTNLEPGEYVITEVTAPAGYELLSDETIVEVNANETFTQIIENMKQTDEVTLGSLIINKIDDETADVLEGAEFEITGPNDFKVTQTTDEQGEIILTNLEPGEYVVKETKAPAGYELSSEDITVEIVEDEVFTQIIENTKQENFVNVGMLKIIKLDGDNKKTLKGAIFKLVDEKGKVIQPTLVTDQDGEILVEDLPFGTYEIIEIEAPKGYKLKSTAVKVEITSADEIEELEVLNFKEGTPITPGTDDGSVDNNTSSNNIGNNTPGNNTDSNTSSNNTDNNGANDGNTPDNGTLTPGTIFATPGTSTLGGSSVTPGTSLSNGGYATSEGSTSNSGDAKSVLLPQTGESNTSWMIVVGTILLVLAVIAFFVTRRQKNI